MTKVYEGLLKALQGYERIYIQPHNIPDPDAIASAFGLKSFLEAQGLAPEIVYVEPVEKANSKTMLDIFGIDMMLMDNKYVLDGDEFIILIDTQLSHSNVTNLNPVNVGVVDHHRFMGNEHYKFIDIRPDFGACSTIIASYFREAGVRPNQSIATALLYAIMTDTDNLVRSSNQMDLEMFYWLYKMSDLSQIKHLRMNEIGLADLEAYTRALQNIEIYGSTCFVDVGDCNDSLQGTISDMVFTIENVDTIVSYAKRDDGIKLSIRSGDKKNQGQ